MKRSKRSKRSRFKKRKFSTRKQQQLPPELWSRINKFEPTRFMPILSRSIYKALPSIQKTKEFYKRSLNIRARSNIELEETITRYPNLQRLNCSESRITELPPNLNKLQKLVCNETPITELPHNLNNLQKLVCAWTRITELPQNLNNLQELNCSWTRITKLP